MERIDSNPRLARGVAIARSGAVRELRPDLWSVRSQSHSGTYMVDLAASIGACTCPDFTANEALSDFACKHLFAVRVHTKKIDLPVTEERKQTYGQDWAGYTAAQEHEREHFDRLLRDLCSSIRGPEQRRGRPRMPLADVVFALVTQAYLNRSGRRVVSDVRAAASAGLIESSMSSKTISKYMNDPALNDLLRVLLRESAAPLASVESRIAVDATGMSTCSHVRWYDEKHGRQRSRKV